MGISILTPASAPDDIQEISLEFPDNRLLVDLCGEFDRNLAHMESMLGVQILRRGNHLTVIGEESARQQAAQVLQDLYQRLEEGRQVESADVDAALRMSNAPEEQEEDAGAQLEMFAGGRVEIKTRKKLVEPRTDAQKAYVRALFEHELCFGIGPAGTGKTYLAVAVAVNKLMDGHVDKIILSRPAVEAGENDGGGANATYDSPSDPI